MDSRANEPYADGGLQFGNPAFSCETPCKNPILYWVTDVLIVITSALCRQDAERE